MCDTIVATADITADGVTLFAKNSDRQPNEAQHIVLLPAQDYQEGSQVKCTYISIPQVEHTHAVLLSKPFWMWGAEMGVNEYGVAIGNEAVFTKVPQQKEPALIGMDLLRLALERAASASEAVTVITELLERFGQGGNCGFGHELYYHNSFLIADPQAAWVLETAGRHWADRQVSGAYSISNVLTLEGDWDHASPRLVDHALENRWCRQGEFSFTDSYSDLIYTRFARGMERICRTRDGLKEQSGQITPGAMMNALRDHHVDGDQPFHPHKGITGVTVCMHAGFGPIRGDQTTGSLVAHLHPERPTVFVTGSAAPCTGIFKPLWLDLEQPNLGKDPTGVYDPETLYWQHERLHRATLPRYPAAIAAYKPDRDQLEKEFTREALALCSSSSDRRASYSAECFARADQATNDWLQRVSRVNAPRRQSWHHALAWNKVNAQANMPELEV